MKGSISQQREFNPGHGRGQITRQKALRYTGPSEGKVEYQGQEMIQWRNGWGYSSCRRHARDSTSIVCQA